MTHASARSTHVRLSFIAVTTALALLGVGSLPREASAATAGSQLWAKRYGIFGDATAQSIGVSPDGATVYVTGYANGTGSGYDYATVAYDATTGVRQWTKTYNGPGNSTDVPSAIRVSPDGSMVIVTGQSYSTTSYDFATFAYDAATGTKLWFKRYNGPQNGGDAP